MDTLKIINELFSGMKRKEVKEVLDKYMQTMRSFCTPLNDEKTRKLADEIYGKYNIDLIPVAIITIVGGIMEFHTDHKRVNEVLTSLQQEGKFSLGYEFPDYTNGVPEELVKFFDHIDIEDGCAQLGYDVNDCIRYMVYNTHEKVFKELRYVEHESIDGDPKESLVIYKKYDF